MLPKRWKLSFKMDLTEDQSDMADEVASIGLMSLLFCAFFSCGWLFQNLQRFSRFTRFFNNYLLLKIHLFKSDQIYPWEYSAPVTTLVYTLNS